MTTRDRSCRNHVFRFAFTVLLGVVGLGLMAPTAVQAQMPPDLAEKIAARALLSQAVEAEVAAFLGRHADELTDDGRQRLVRHGHLPEREIMTGIGRVTVRCPRVRDRAGDGSERIRFSSAILPPYARRSKSLEVLIPILYLKGVSTGDFEEALLTLLGKDAGGLSASTIGRLKDAWSEEHARWSKRDLSAKHYVYFWADGIHVQARLENDAQCLLVIIGATPEGKKELVGLIDGVRESAQSWRELLLDLKRRGLAVAPELAVADGALGFWQALEEVWPTTRSQRCWVHKTANVLNKLPKSQQPKAKRALQEIWMAETKKDALAAFDTFVEIWGVKYDKAIECLIKDRDALLAFYDFPAEHWTGRIEDDSLGPCPESIGFGSNSTEGRMESTACGLRVEPSQPPHVDGRIIPLQGSWAYLRRCLRFPKTHE